MQFYCIGGSENQSVSTRGKPLRPETPAGLAERSPEGTEERRAPYNEVNTALPQRGQAFNSPGPEASGWFSRRLSRENDGPQFHLLLEAFGSGAPLWLQTSVEYEKWHSLNE